MAEICDALDWADLQYEQPAAIIAHTVKGRGVSFMEEQAGFHNAAITPEQFQQAMAELQAGRSST
jgi:transketolase